MAARPVGEQPPRKRQRVHAPPPHPQNHNQQQQQQPPNNSQQEEKKQQQAPQHRFTRLLNFQPINILHNEIQNWMYEQCALSPNIEIEVKLGRLVVIDPEPEEMEHALDIMDIALARTIQMAARPVGAQPPHKRQRVHAPPPAHPQNHHQQEQQPPPRPPNTSQQEARKKQQQQAPQPKVPQLRFTRLLNFQQINILHNEIRHWMYEQCALSPTIEIEVKLGRLVVIDPAPEEMEHVSGHNGHAGTTNDALRVHDKVGIKSLAWIDLQKTGGRFESTVNEKVFRHLNLVLNGWYSNSHLAPHRRLPALRDHPFPKLTYVRSRTVDKIYRINGTNVRVSLDANRGSAQRGGGEVVKEVIEKKRKSRMDLCCPSCQWDLRLSSSIENPAPMPRGEMVTTLRAKDASRINGNLRLSSSIENPAPMPRGEMVTTLRAKDRISYQWQGFSIDISSIHTYSQGLTKPFIDDVVQKFRAQEPLPTDLQYGTLRTFEVELEIANKKYMQSARKLMAENNPFQFTELCYFFTQHAVQLVELASNSNYKPAVSKLPTTDDN
eukprot:CAMPEP_0202725902 /NCGR_PEP_ID=MMETSP1385-20130828/184335_1 /ASSEMBLY_ACC=CAM_ASM_000861 /TAXON_ID=933848 /ORGANISM="Elphidium margaritaceum" /LENGTH=550 /DNA_ID=CAMNT_0049392107 /DNA_START=1194 /DNA_END=2848 /DNA_ORIENTATION=-